MWLHKASVPRDEHLSPSLLAALTLTRSSGLSNNKRQRKKNMGLGVPSEMKFSAAISLLTSVTAAANKSPKVVYYREM